MFRAWDKITSRKVNIFVFVMYFRFESDWNNFVCGFGSFTKKGHENSLSLSLIIAEIQCSLTKIVENLIHDSVWIIYPSNETFSTTRLWSKWKFLNLEKKVGSCQLRDVPDGRIRTERFASRTLISQRLRACRRASSAWENNFHVAGKPRPSSKISSSTCL